jgi:hypothetical protein
MAISIDHYIIFCATEGCDWSVCWFGVDPWADHVCCPHHPGTMQVPGRNRPGDPARYQRRSIQYTDQYENAYGSTKIVPKVPFPSY